MEQHTATKSLADQTLFVHAYSGQADQAMELLAKMPFGERVITIARSHDSLWAVVEKETSGGVALRLVYSPGGFLLCGTIKPLKNGSTRFVVETPAGKFSIVLKMDGTDLYRLRATVTLRPTRLLYLPFVPRDLYPLGPNGDPMTGKSTVHAKQRGLNSGLLYFSGDEPDSGSVLYFQNFTALNPYFAATGTTPHGAVGGEWPELGYLMPTPSKDAMPTDATLPAGKDTVLSDAILIFRDEAAQEECGSARQFLQMLGAVYTALDLPSFDYRDWPERSKRTLADLDQSEKATIRHYGHRYAHPYTASEYPDSMVQLSLLTSMQEYAQWRGEPIALAKDFSRGLEKFFDPKLGSVRRYLPNVGKDKDADAVDSWYLYHPLLNLARLAIAGDEAARDLFMRSIDFGIAAAHHFQYQWPIQYKVTDFSVITEVAGADGRGQTDVGGLYAWVMLQAYELTREERFLHEAQAAIDAAVGMRFHINYQANLTAWGAAACLRLWRITNIEQYREQSYVYLASFFHNCAIWESEIEGATKYRNFLGVTCLQDAPYMAIYECFDSFAAFECYLRDSGPELEPSARMLISEYCKYALDRAWFYYPDALPEELLATEIRNGHIDRTLSFPLEDLYIDGKPAGQVGQEIYGAGAAFVFASRMFHSVSDAPFRLFCDHFIMASERTGEKAISISLDGGETCSARLALVPTGRTELPASRVVTTGGDAVRPRQCPDGRVEFQVPARGRLVLSWE